MTSAHQMQFVLRRGAMTQQPAGYLCRGGVPDMEWPRTTVVAVCAVVRSITGQLEHLHRVVW